MPSWPCPRPWRPFVFTRDMSRNTALTSILLSSTSQLKQKVRQETLAFVRTLLSLSDNSYKPVVWMLHELNERNLFEVGYCRHFGMWWTWSLADFGPVIMDMPNMARSRCTAKDAEMWRGVIKKIELQVPAGRSSRKLPDYEMAEVLTDPPERRT
jgi:hypothetical protein